MIAIFGVILIAPINCATFLALPKNGLLSANDIYCGCDGAEIGSKLRLEGDCSLYCYCGHPHGSGNLILSCESGLHFNAVNGICEEPEIAGCVQSKDITPPVPTEGIPPLTNPRPDADSRCQCAEKTSYGNFVPLANDCTKFCLCDSFGQRIFHCPEGMHFDAELKVCRLAELALCDASVDRTTAPTISTPEPTTITTTTTAVDLDKKCQCNLAAYGDLVPFTDDCTKYCICEFNEFYGNSVFQCRDDLHFNAELRICDSPERAQSPTTRNPGILEDPFLPTTSSVVSPDFEGKCSCRGKFYGDIVPHRDDSTKFCVCQYAEGQGNMVVQCTNDMQFNPETKRCGITKEHGTTLNSNPEDDVKCECAGRKHGDLIAYQGDCGKFCTCLSYITGPRYVVKECPSGLYFNPTSCVCDWPLSTGCIREQATTSGVVVTQTPTESSTTVTQQPVTQNLDLQCRLNCEGQMYGALVPIARDCTQYCVCLSSTPGMSDMVLPCDTGLHFNKDTKMCEKPEEAGCQRPDEPKPTSDVVVTQDPSRPDDSKTTVPTSTQETETTLPTYYTPTKTTLPTPTKETETPAYSYPDYDGKCDCAKSNKHGDLIAYSGDCGKFCTCMSPEPGPSNLVTDCDDGLYFNPTSCVCDWPLSAGCIEEQAPPESTTTVTPNLDLQCRLNCEGQIYGALVPIASDCTQYCVCLSFYEGMSDMVLACDTGLHFNKDTKMCEKPEEAGCQRPDEPKPTSDVVVTQDPPRPDDSKPTLPTPTKDNETSLNSYPDYDGKCICAHSKHADLIAYPGDCGKFCTCLSPKPGHLNSVTVCPDGLYFNPQEKICDWPLLAGCDAVVPTPTLDDSSKCQCPNDMYSNLAAYKDDCSKFCMCEPSEGLGNVVYHCKAGYHYNATLKACNIPEHAECVDLREPLTTIAVIPTPSYYPEGRIDKDNKCSCNKDIHGQRIALESDCTKYCQCKNGENGFNVIVDCKGGHHFNADLGVCDEPQFARCEVLPVMPTPPHQ